MDVHRYKTPPPTALRDINAALRALRIKEQTGADYMVKKLGLRPTWPFWSRLPHINMFTSITPDHLHQLLKGVFLEHLVKWFLSKHLIGHKIIDSRYQLMSPHHGMQHFPHGITSVSQWTGREVRGMMKCFICIIAGTTHLAAIRAARSLLDFIYISHFTNASETDLSRMDSLIKSWDQQKNIFMSSGACDSFDSIPKLHMIQHYIHFTREVGATDGFNSESPERHHRECAKKGYQESNKNEATEQMTIYLQRHESLTSWSAFMDWRNDNDSEGHDSDEESDENEDGYPDMETQHALHCLHAPRSLLAFEETQGLVLYPNPSTLHANSPTSDMRTKSLGWISSELNIAANSFFNSTSQFLHRQLGNIAPTLMEYDTFDLFRSITLVHTDNPGGAVYGTWREVIRASPPRRSVNRRRYCRKAKQDTALMLEQPELEGLQSMSTVLYLIYINILLLGYRAVRVKTIFLLPRRIRHLYSGILAYVELFTRFGHGPSNEPAGLYQTSHSLTNGSVRQSLVIPVEKIRMSCHLAPRFHTLSTESREKASLPDGDILDVCKSFYFNPFSSHFMYSYMNHWHSYRN